VQEAHPPFKLGHTGEDADTNFIMMVDRGPSKQQLLFAVMLLFKHVLGTFVHVQVGNSFASLHTTPFTYALANVIVLLAASIGEEACKFAVKVWNAQQAGAQAVSSAVTDLIRSLLMVLSTLHVIQLDRLLYPSICWE